MTKMRVINRMFRVLGLLDPEQRRRLQELEPARAKSDGDQVEAVFYRSGITTAAEEETEDA